MRKLLVFAAFAALVVGIAACTGDDDDDDVATSPTPSPSPSPTAVYRNVTVNLSNSNIAAGTVMVRFKRGTTVDACITRTSAANAATLTTNGKLLNGATYDVVEFVIDQNANSVADASPGTDHSYDYASLTVSSNVVLNLNHTTPTAGGWSNAQAITWQNASGCPGP